MEAMKSEEFRRGTKKLYEYDFPSARLHLYSCASSGWLSAKLQQKSVRASKLGGALIVF